MIINPKYVKVGDKKYKINTSYKVALKCDKIVKDNKIIDYEKSLALIYLLFGEEALRDKANYNKLVELSYKYLSCGEEPKERKAKKDFDFEQDFKLIRASLKSDYGIDILQEDIDWWDFVTYINGLTDNCILDKVRELRNTDASTIKDNKERQRMVEAQQYWALDKEEVHLTKEQQQSVDEFYKSLNF